MKKKLYQIQTPSQSTGRNKISFGIDLGTTNSVLAFVDSGKVSILTKDNNKGLFPSVVQLVSKKGEYFLVRSIKRLMGKTFEEAKKSKIHQNINIVNVDGYPKIDTVDKKISPEEISSDILKKIKKSFRDEYSKEIDQAVITVPAFFSDIERQATKKAAELAGIKVLRIINEPTAALLAYGLDDLKSGSYIVYDLGGGTFDVSVLEIENGVFQVKSTVGDTELGGDDIDILIAEYFGVEDHEFKQYAKELKHQLTNKSNAKVIFNSREYTLDSAKLREISEPVLNMTLELVKDAVEQSDTNSFDGVVLVGGSTKMPIVKEFLSEKLPYELLDNLNPETIVAKGAAIQADKLLNKNRDILLIDVNPISLGIEVIGGMFERIIQRNTPIPASKTEYFSTFKDNQSSLKINIYQGEREFVKNCRFIGELTLDNIPLMLAGTPRVRISFTLDESSMLTVNAIEEITGIEQTVSLNSKISKQDSIAILKDSIKNSAEDSLKKEIVIQKTSLTKDINELKDKIYSYNASDLKTKILKFISSTESEFDNIQTIEDIHYLQKRIDDYFSKLEK